MPKLDDVNEEGTVDVDVVFKDENGAAEVPTAATWTLTDRRGTVINSRSAVTIGSLASTVTITLSGADLAVQSGETARLVPRRLLVKATYDSSLGTGLPMTEEFTFNVINFAGI